MGNLKSREREAGNPARALPLCAQLNDSKIPRLRFVPFKMLYLEKLDRANVVPLKPYNRQWWHKHPWNSTSAEGKEVDVFIYS